MNKIQFLEQENNRFSEGHIIETENDVYIVTSLNNNLFLVSLNTGKMNNMSYFENSSTSLIPGFKALYFDVNIIIK